MQHLPGLGHTNDPAGPFLLPVSPGKLVPLLYGRGRALEPC